jgi:beta-phosphoglucomutase-like phosphatase (HAD superfamily)
MNISRVTSVFIDFDGTLINSIDNLYDSYCDLLNIYGLKGSKEEFNILNGPSTFEVVEILKAKHRLLDTEKNIYENYIEIIKKNYGKSEAFSDSEMFLSSLYERGKKLVLVTSSRAEMCLPIIERLNWRRFFTAFVWGENVKHSKPFPDIYLEACRQLRVQNCEVVAIEDSINGVKAAHSAGLVVFGLSIDFNKKDLEEAGATKVFDCLSHVLDNSLLI